MTASAFFALVVLSAAFGQQPLVPPLVKDAPDKAISPPKATPLDAHIAAALRHDPDVQVAKAKVQLAEAELAKARQQVAVKVTALHGVIERQKSEAAFQQKQIKRFEELFQTGAIDLKIVEEARAKLEAARAALAASEAELKLLTGPEPAAAAPPGTVHADSIWMDVGTQNGLKWLAPWVAKPPSAAGEVRGAIPVRLRGMLDKPVKLKKGIEVKWHEMIDAFKEQAGFDVPVRGGPLTWVVSEGEELPLAAWLQMIQDATPGFEFYVREYGLLFAERKSAPPDALTLKEFWKAKPQPDPNQIEPGK